MEIARLDPHSYTHSSHPLVKHMPVIVYFDFTANTIHGSALLTLPAAHTSHLLLDTRSLLVHSVINRISGAPIPMGGAKMFSRIRAWFLKYLSTWAFNV
ncbi:hypothetical protein ZIOFF_048024 [Zingiber officinale]|uniref:Uncharacterized protein n=1 Tax=Zingiber officinale TaxID=94328 RepID=A0A8J5FUA9_ZINOF|nr:hypothetical protein ZIOFF_048024 [Zingiber officinale]